MLDLTNPLAQPHPGNRRYIVDRFIPEGKLVSLYGDGGLGKSLILTFLGLCVTSGYDFLGLSTKRGHVIYLDGEDDLDEFVRRAKAMTNAHNFVGNIGYHRVVRPINQGFMDELLVTCVHYSTILVIVDSFSALSGGNLDNETVMTFMNGFRQLGISVMFLDHEPKYNDSQLGPNSKKNQSRAQYHLEDWYDPTGKMLKLTQTKSNIGDLKEPIYVKMISVPDQINPTHIHIERAFPVVGTNGSTKDRIVLALQVIGIGMLGDIVIETGLASNIVSIALSRLVKDGTVKSDGLKPASYSL